jgi:hypothetical protein
MKTLLKEYLTQFDIGHGARMGRYDKARNGQGFEKEIEFLEP